MRKRLFFIIMPLVLVLVLMTALVASAGGPWSDNFDSYTNGQDLHGVNGWKGWDNAPAATAFVSNAQAHSSPNSVDINGASDLVQQFTTVTSGQWTLTAWQYIPGNMQGITYFIVNSDYADGGPYLWSVQVQFDGTSGMMFDDGASGASQSYIADQWVEIRLEVDLDNDTQDFYYNGALFYSGTMTTHQSGGGQLAIEALDLYANNATSVYYDDVSLVPTVVGEPGLDVGKSPDTQDVTTGGNADFTIDITNTGTITWSNVTATDALVPACDNATTDLGPGESFSYTCTHVGVASSYTNTIVVVGDVVGGPTMTVSDTAVVNVNAPTSVSLSGFGSDNAGVPAGLVVVSLGAVLAAGFFIVSRRRQQI